MEQNDKDKRGKEFIKNYLRDSLNIRLSKEPHDNGVILRVHVELDGEIIDSDSELITIQIK